MSATDDRLLDLVLREHFGSERAPDVLEPVLRAVRTQSGRSRRVPRWSWTAAALLVAALAAYLITADREPQGPQLRTLQAGIHRFDDVPPGGIAVDTQWGRILLQPRSRSQIVVPAPDSLLLTVFAGPVALADDDLPAGTEVFLRSGLAPLTSTLPSEEDRAALDMLVADLQRSESDLLTSPTYVEDLRRIKAARNGLVDMTERSPALFAYVLPRLVPVPRSEERRDVRDRVLELLARDPELRAERLLVREVTRDATSLATQTLMALAARGLTAATRALQTRLDTLTGWPRVRVAAWFGLRADGRGRSHLVAGLEDPQLYSGDPDLYLAVVVALEQLGASGHWTAAWERTRTAIEGYLSTGRLDTARQEVLRLAYFHRALRARQPVELARLSEAVVRYAAGREATLPTAAAIRRELAQLGP